MRNGLKCADAAWRLHEYIDDTLPPQERQGVERHLRSCEGCRRVLLELECTRRLLRSLPRAPMPDSMKATLLSALRDLPLPTTTPQPALPDTAPGVRSPVREAERGVAETRRRRS